MNLPHNPCNLSQILANARLVDIVKILSERYKYVLFKNYIIKINDSYVTFMNDTDLFLCTFGIINYHNHSYKIIDDDYRNEFCGVVGLFGAYSFKNAALINLETGICYDSELNRLVPDYPISLHSIHYVKKQSKCVALDTITLFCGTYADGIFTTSGKDIYKFFNKCKYMYLEDANFNEFLLSEHGKLIKLQSCKRITNECGDVEYNNMYYMYDPETDKYIRLRTPALCGKSTSFVIGSGVLAVGLIVGIFTGFISVKWRDT